MTLEPAGCACHTSAVETTRKAWRRWFGLLFLILAGAQLLWGFTLLRDTLRGWGFLAYWLMCFAFAAAALVVAVVDWVAIRREARAERRRLLLDALSAVATRQRERATPPADDQRPEI
jgi:hypothetical protein